MENDLAYIKNLETNELEDIISNLWGFEETSEALLELERRDPQKALHLGMEILENAKGDDYLQASVWDIIFKINPENVLKCLEKREETMGKILLYDIFRELNSRYYIKDIKSLPKQIIEKILHDYDELFNGEDNEINKEVIEFCEQL